MTDKKDAKMLNIQQDNHFYYVDFSTEKQNVLYNSGLIITKKLFLKCICFSHNWGQGQRVTSVLFVWENVYNFGWPLKTDVFHLQPSNFNWCMLVLAKPVPIFTT